MRKPVQIAIANNGNFLHMCVLCDDGSMWAGSSGKGLTRLSDIPQDEPEQPATSPDVVAALRELEQATSQYRFEVGLGQNGRTAFPWDRMRQARDATRAVLKRIDEQ